MAQIIRRARQQFNQPIGVVRMDTGAAEVANAFAEAGESIRRQAYQVDAEEAKKRGEEAAAAAPSIKLRAYKDGEPVDLSPPEGFGRIARESYRAVIERRFLETMDTDIRLKSKELAGKYDRSPLQYDNAMQAYLDGLAESTEGRFKQFVVDSGSAIKESTHLGLVDEARTRARADAAQHIVSTNSEFNNQIRMESRTGNFSAVDKIIEEREQATLEGEGAGLKVGSSSIVASEMAGAAAAEYLVTQMNALSRTNRERILAAITSNYSLPSGGKAEEVYQNVAKYIDANNKQSVVAELNAAKGDLDALDAAIKAEAAKAGIALRQEQLFDSNRDQRSMLYNSSKAANDAFYKEDGVSIETSLFAISNTFQEELRELEAYRRSNDQFDLTDFERESNELRQAALSPFITRAAAEGNSETFRQALASGKPDAIAMLTENQQDVIAGIYKYGLFDGSRDDLDFVSPLISQASSSIEDSHKMQQAVIDLETGFNDLLAKGETNGFDSINMDAYLKDSKGIDPRVVDGLYQKYNFFVAKEDFSRISNFVSSTAPDGAGSLAIDSIVAYINSGDETGITETLKGLSDVALEGLLPIQREQIETHLRSISSGLKKEEAAQASARKTTAKIAQFNLGALDRGSKEAQNISEAIVLTNGFDISDLETLTPEIERTMAKALPTFLVNSLNNLAAGQGDPNAQNVLSIYSRLRDYQITMSEGLGLQANRINALNDIISVERQMMLNEMLIGTESGIYSTAREASIEVAKLMKTSASKAAENVSAFFIDDKGNSISPAKYITEIFNGDIDPYLIKEFGTMAKLLVAKGFDPEKVKDELLSQYDTRYRDSKYVFDGARGFNNQGRSRFALSAGMPDPKRESYFINKVENQLLSMGYTLFNHNDGSSISSTDVFDPVVLVPMFSGVSPAQQLYQAYKVIDEGDSRLIEPVVLEDGSMPAFNISDETKELASDLEITEGKTYEQLEGNAKAHRYLQENGLISGAPFN
jgi:hypothetical protein